MHFLEVHQSARWTEALSSNVDRVSQISVPSLDIMTIVVVSDVRVDVVVLNVSLIMSSDRVDIGVLDVP